jgi:hypothetical protein
MYKKELFDLPENDLVAFKLANLKREMSMINHRQKSKNKPMNDITARSQNIYPTNIETRNDNFMNYSGRLEDNENQPFVGQYSKSAKNINSNLNHFNLHFRAWDLQDSKSSE